MDDTTTLPQSRLDVPGEVDESAFFSLPDGTPTLSSHADLEATVPNEEKPNLRELERYWVNEPFAFVVIYRNVAQQEFRYYLVEPTLDETERALVDFFSDKLTMSLEYDSVSTDATPRERAEVVRDETIRLMDRYNLLDRTGSSPNHSTMRDRLREWLIAGLRKRAVSQHRDEDVVDPIPVDRDPDTGERRSLDEQQVETVLYYLVRNFIRYDRIDGLKHDVNVEDISCDGYNEPVFVYHGSYGQMLTNVTFGRDELDDFVIKLAQRARKGISKRQPNVNATLTDGSRAQLTLGREVSDRGTNFTIRQFRDVPFTPVDLVTWETYSLSQMVYLWLAVENGKSMVIAGGTASGKTTTLNALSLFVSSDSKIVSIEDTRELLIPQRNWVANTTRESFSRDDDSDIDEFELLEDALRQRPDYIVMGEVRGEEGRTLFQAMNTGHTVCTTFHANSPKQVIRRFTQEPINVASSMFGAVDLVANQTSTKVDGQRVRRATSIVEIDEYDAEADEFVIDETYTWDSVDDEIRANASGTTDLMEQVRLDNGWSEAELEREWRRREAVLAYLIREGVTSYAGVAAAIQAYMHSPDVLLSLIGQDELAARIDDLTTMRTVDIDVDDEIEALVPRPTPGADLRERVDEILNEASDLFDEYDEPSRARTGSEQPDGSTKSASAPAGDTSSSGPMGPERGQSPQAGRDSDDVPGQGPKQPDVARRRREPQHTNRSHGPDVDGVSRGPTVDEGGRRPDTGEVSRGPDDDDGGRGNTDTRVTMPAPEPPAGDDSDRPESGENQ